MEVIPGSVRSNGNGAEPPKGGGAPAAGEKPRGGNKPDKETKGRKDGGTEVEPNAAELMKGMKKMKSLLEAKQSSAAAYNKERKALAKRAGFQADVVELTVRAFIGEKEDFEIQHRKAEQLTLAFEAVHREQFAA